MFGMQRKLLHGRDNAHAWRDAWRVGAMRLLRRRTATARERVLRELLDDAHRRIRELEHTIARLLARL
jgi:hypothetical protein